MKRIGITQRVDFVPRRNEYVEGIDCRWAVYLQKLSFIFFPLSCHVEKPERHFEDLKLDGFLLTGGNDIGSYPPRDQFERRVLTYSQGNNIPVFGICRGLQFINHIQGGRSVEKEGHVAVSHKVFGPLLSSSDFRVVNSYHDWVIQEEDVGRDLLPLAFAEDGTVEALKHKTLPWMAIMWHPEREEAFLEEDCRLMNNHFLGKTI